ncbi:MAG: hypothetical protein WD646_06970 [Actinomycetota bacterium]
MVGLILKVFFFISVLVVGTLVALNATNVWNPGTLRLTAPSVDACHRWAEINRPNDPTELVEVRWIWTSQNYGWGCHFEFGDFDVLTVTPMPK